MPEDLDDIVVLDSDLREVLIDFYNYCNHPWLNTFTTQLFDLISIAQHDEFSRLMSSFPVQCAVFLMYTSAQEKESFFKKALGSDYILLRNPNGI